MITKKLKLCFVGNMLGRNAGFVTTQGQIIADLFEREGFDVISTSSKINKVKRLADIVFTLMNNRQNIDVVVLEVYSGLNMIMADVTSQLCSRLKIPLIAVLHGGNLPVFMARYPNWTTRILKRADILISPSRYIADAVAFYDLSAQVIPNVINIEFYPFRQRSEIAPRLLWMRAFHQIYNPQMALKVLSLLRQSFQGANLVMAGSDKGLENETKKLAAEMGLSQVVRFPGFLNKTDKIREFSKADIYINTNQIDNMPVALVEAWAMGIPVVSTDVGGVSRMISNRENGLLVQNNNAADMTEAITMLINNPELTKYISQNGRVCAEHSSWEAVRQSWLNQFAEIFRNKKQIRDNSTEFNKNPAKSEKF